MKNFTTWFGNLSDGTKKTIVAIIGLTAALSPLLLIGGKLVGGIKGLLPLLSTLSAHPIIAIIGLVAVLLTTLYASNEKFRNSVNKLFKSLEPLLDIGTELLNGILEPLTDIFQSLFDLLGELAPFITDVLNVSLASIAVSLIPTMFVLETIYKLIESVITGFKDLITLNWGGFADNQKAIWSDWKSDDFASSSLENLKNSITGFGTSSTADTTSSGITSSSAGTTSIDTSAGTTSTSSSVDNSTTTNYITIESNEYMNADELVDAVSKKLTLKLQARS